jgi:hypothetical protein
LVAIGNSIIPEVAGGIYTSTDTGATWALSSASPPNTGWSSVASSADGMKLVAAGEIFLSGPTDGYGAIYTSTNSGLTWTMTTAPHFPWAALASSADGSEFVAASGAGLIVFSVDSGATWTSADAPAKAWTAITSSGDGSKLVAASDYLDFGGGSVDGNICTLQFPLPPLAPPPSPKLSMGALGQNVGVSWLVPSSGYVLQQNPDLNTTNWIDVQVSPTLNSTNLHYDVTVSPSASHEFYRLKQR